MPRSPRRHRLGLLSQNEASVPFTTGCWICLPLHRTPWNHGKALGPGLALFLTPPGEKPAGMRPHCPGEPGPLWVALCHLRTVQSAPGSWPESSASHQAQAACGFARRGGVYLYSRQRCD